MKWASFAPSVADRASAVYAGQETIQMLATFEITESTALFDNSPPVIHSFTLTTAGSINNKKEQQIILNTNLV